MNTLCFVLGAIIEKLYYISGIVVAFGVLFVIRQYSLSKKENKEEAAIIEREMQEIKSFHVKGFCEK